MKRKDFLRSLAGITFLSTTSMKLSALEKHFKDLPKTERMPVMFVGHGNPMNAIEDNEYSRGWKKVASDLSPTAILCVSAHWESRGTFITANEHPKTIHDFGGFPQALFDAQYPAPGAPQLAADIQQHVEEPQIELTDRWGLDHGTWSVLLQMFPKADVPVLQMSIDRSLSPTKMYELGRRLAFLRTRGVLIMGSGNVVHNLGMVRWGNDPEPYDWALEFDEKVKTLIEQRDHKALIDYHQLGKAAELSIPTREHYVPLLYVLGLQEKDEDIRFFNEQIAFGSGSMRSLLIEKV